MIPGISVEYVNESEEASKPDGLWEWVKDVFVDKEKHVIRNIDPYKDSPNKLQSIFYYDKVSQYATPVELMINLLEISQSKDFINSFIETVGNGNYIKLKLYTMCNQEIHFINEDYTRKTDVDAERDLKFSAEVVGSRYTGEVGDGQIGGDSYEEGVTNGVYATVSEHPFEDKIKVILHNWNGGNKDLYKYRVKITCKTKDADGNYTKPAKTRAYPGAEFSDESEFNISLGKYNIGDSFEDSKEIDIYPEWKRNDVDDLDDESRIIRTTQITNITTQYYAGISEIRTWYGSYDAENTVNRNYKVLKRVGGRQDEGGTSFVSVDGSGVKSIPHRDSFKAVDLYNQLINSGVEIEPVSYVTTTSWKSDWARQNFLDLKKLSIKEWDDIEDKESYSEDELLNTQINYIVQEENDFDYDEFHLYNYKLTYAKQTDDNLKVIDIKMNYTETLNEGITGGLVTTNDLRIYTFLGLLSNAYDGPDANTEPDGKYHLGAMFVPKSSGGKLVSYEDLYNGESEVGPLLENGEEMLYTLLEESTTTNGLVPVMRYAMYLYKNNNYIILITQANEWSFNIFDEEKMKELLQPTI